MNIVAKIPPKYVRKGRKKGRVNVCECRYEGKLVHLWVETKGTHIIQEFTKADMHKHFSFIEICF